MKKNKQQLPKPKKRAVRIELNPVVKWDCPNCKTEQNEYWNDVEYTSEPVDLGMEMKTSCTKCKQKVILIW